MNASYSLQDCYIGNLLLCEVMSLIQTGHGAHLATYTMGTRFFPGVKWPGRVTGHPPPSIVEVKENVELYLYSHSGLCGLF
jgi:hypothetical protein